MSQPTGYWAIQQRGEHEDWSFMANPPFEYKELVACQQSITNLRMANADANHYIEYRPVLIQTLD